MRIINNLRKNYRKSVLGSVFSSLRQNPRIIFYIILLDLLFLGIMYSLNYAVEKYFLSTDFNLLIVVSIIYFLLLILIVSFFNFLVLENLKKLLININSSHKYDFSLFKKFFILNLLFFIIFFVIIAFFTYSYRFLLQKQLWIAIIVFTIFVLMFVLFYIFYNFGNSLLALTSKISNSLLLAFKYLFSKRYFGLLVLNIVSIFLYLLFYFLFIFIFDKFDLSLDALISFYTIILFLLFYLLFFINRIYFLFIAERNIKYIKNKK